MKKPNVVLFFTDQMRYDAVRCNGNHVIETPNIDWLASEGTVFERAYTPCPSCIPARACLLSGLTPWHTGILGMGKGQKPMGVNFKHTIPGELRKANYYSKGVGKMHFFPQRALNGFDSISLDESGRIEDKNFQSDYLRWFDQQKGIDTTADSSGIGWNSWMARPWPHNENLHPTVWTTGEALRFLQTKDPSMPYFLKVSYSRPHSPYDAPDYYFRMYQDESLQNPNIGEWAEVNNVEKDASFSDAWRGKRLDKEIKRAKMAYYGQITHIDNQIGRIITWLKKNEELDNTLFIFSSDHGDMLGDHYLWRKTYAYEGSARIPLIIKLPKCMRENTVKKCDKLVSLYDIMPTILDCCNLPIPIDIDGKSLLPLIKNTSRDWREWIHGEHCECYAPEQEMQFITDGTYKYIWFPRIGTEQLFDLKNDPGELHDLATENAFDIILEKFRQNLISLLIERGSMLVQKGQLKVLQSDEVEISPCYEKRLKSSDYNWEERTFYES